MGHCSYSCLSKHGTQLNIISKLIDQDQEDPGSYSHSHGSLLDDFGPATIKQDYCEDRTGRGNPIYPAMGYLRIDWKYT